MPTELAAIECRLKNCFSTFPHLLIRYSFILTCNEDIHNILNDFKFQLDWLFGI